MAGEGGIAGTGGAAAAIEGVAERPASSAFHA